MSLEKIVRLLDTLTRDDQLRLVGIISERLRATADPDPEPAAEDGPSRRYLPRLPQMIQWGVVKPKDRLYIWGHEDQPALLLNPSEVVYNAQIMSINDWAKLITGWTAVNIYESVVLERDDRTLQQIRLAYMEEHGLE